MRRPSERRGTRRTRDAQDAGTAAIVALLVFGAFTFTFVAISARLFTKGIVDSVNRLDEGAIAFGAGNFDHRIEPRTTDELGTLAIAFNAMAGERKRTEADLTKHRHELEELVETRTAQLSEANVNLELKMEERVRAETAMRESEERIRLLLESTGEGIYGLDLDGNCTFCNPACIKILGYKSENDLLGKNMHDLIHHTRANGSPFPVAECRIYGVFGNGLGVHVDDEILWKADGSSFEAEYRSYPVRREGEVIGSVVTFTDIARRRKGERESEELAAQLRQSQKMEAIGTLAGGIAHDFNNSLLAIMGFGQMAYEDAPEGTPLRDNIEEIIRAADRSAKLVDQILTFSRKTDEDKKPVELRNIVEEAMKLLRPTLPASIRIVCDFNGHPPTILADATQMHQVVVNLVTNAAMAIGSEDGEIEVTLEKCEIDHDFAAFHPPLRFGPHLRLRVCDTGCGMAPEILERIFEPFFTTKEVGKGTGMGLAVVHTIVERHKGAITVESKVDKGTTFTILFPERKVSAHIEAPIDEYLSAAGNGKGRILLVEDESTVLRLLTRALEGFGYSVVPMESSTKALMLFLNDPQSFDAVITDLTMPEMTGDVLVRKLLRARPDIGVILCTGYSEKMGREEALGIGVRRYLKKPFSIQALVESVQQVLQEAS